MLDQMEPQIMAPFASVGGRLKNNQPRDNGANVQRNNMPGKEGAGIRGILKFLPFFNK
jgi:hypothetical protein